MIRERWQSWHLVIHRQRYHGQWMEISHQRPGEHFIPVDLILEHGIARDIKLVIPIGKAIRQHRWEDDAGENSCSECPEERVIGEAGWFGRCYFLLFVSSGLFWLCFAHAWAKVQIPVGRFDCAQRPCFEMRLDICLIDFPFNRDSITSVILTTVDSSEAEMTRRNRRAGHWAQSKWPEGIERPVIERSRNDPEE